MIITQRNGDRLFPVRSAIPIPNGVPGSTNPGTYFDLNTEVTTLTSSWNDWLLEYNSSYDDQLTVENLTPDVCSTENFPLVERIESGVGKVRMESRGIVSVFSKNFTPSGGSVSTIATGFQDDTVGKSCEDRLLQALSSGGDLNYYTDSSNLVRNDNCWAAGFDLSGVAIWNSSTGDARKAGAAITRRHLLYTWHYRPSVGNTVKFLDADGSAHTRTILAINAGGSFNLLHENPLVSDKCVAVLDSDLPDSVAVYPVVGEWVYQTTEDPNGYDATVGGWLGIKVNQSRNVYIAGCADLYPRVVWMESGSVYGETFGPTIISHYTDFGPYGEGVTSLFPAFLEEYGDYYTTAIGGDSGSPAFLIMPDDSLVLAGCVSSSSGSGNFPHKDILDAMIASADAVAGVSTGYTVTESDNPAS